MKNYNEVAESVFRRSEEIIEKNNRRRKTLIGIGSAAGCLLVAGAVGFGVWRNSVRGSDVQIIGDIYLNGSGAATGESAYSSTSDPDDLVGSYSGAGYTAPEYTALDGDSIDSSGAFSSSSSSGADDPGYATSTSEPAPSEPSSVIGSTPSVSDQAPEYVTIIGEYPEINSGAYDAPANGTVLLSDPLKGAMEEYIQTEKEKYFFDVYVNFYKDGENVDIDSSEFRSGEENRLCECGFECKYEECRRMPSYKHCRMLLTREQLEDFASSEDYGYIISLCGECQGGGVCLFAHDQYGHHNGYGQGNGQVQSSQSSQSVPQDNEQSYGQGYGPGNGQGYGPGNGQGYGPGNGQGYGHHYGHHNGEHC